MDEPMIIPGSPHYNDTSKLYPGKNYGYYKAQEVEVYKIRIN